MPGIAFNAETAVLAVNPITPALIIVAALIQKRKEIDYV